MRAITLYSDEETNNELSGNIVFEPINVGASTTKVLYVKNNLQFSIMLQAKFDNEEVVIGRPVMSLEPGEIQPLELLMNPKITSIKPIKGSLSFDVQWVIK